MKGGVRRANFYCIGISSTYFPLTNELVIAMALPPPPVEV
jgi:hypothetical protein